MPCFCSTCPGPISVGSDQNSAAGLQDFDTHTPLLLDDYMLGCLNGFVIATNSEAPSRSTPPTQDLNPHTSTLDVHPPWSGDFTLGFLDGFTMGTNSESSDPRAIQDHLPLTPLLSTLPPSAPPLSTPPLSTPPLSTSTTSTPSTWSDGYMLGYRDALDHARLFGTPGSHMPPRGSPSGSQTYETHIAPEDSSTHGTMPNPSNSHSMETPPPEFSGNSSTLFSYRCVGTETYTHRCDICGCTFRRPYLLRDHVRTHTGEKIKVYPCQFEGCTRAFSSRSNMIRHLKSHFPSDNTPGTPGVDGEEILGQPPVAGPSTHVRGTRRSDRKIRFRPYKTPDKMRARVGDTT